MLFYILVSVIRPLCPHALNISLVYDDPSPVSNLAEGDLLERLLSTHETVVNAKVHSYGPPPFNLELQREWYQEALLDSIKAAARNAKSDAMASDLDTLGPSQA